MTVSSLDWGYVRRHTAIPLLSAVVFAVLLVAGVLVFDWKQQRHSQLHTDRSAMQHDYEALLTRRRIVERYHRRYQQFSALGFVGDERRIDWLEILRQATDDLRLPRLAYVIEPQQQALTPVEATFASGDVAIRVSTVQLDIGLLHEEDLLHVIDALQTHAPGLIAVDGCTLNWLVQAPDRPGADANINAQCSLRIFSVITSDVPGGVAS